MLTISARAPHSGYTRMAPKPSAITAASNGTATRLARMLTGVNRLKYMAINGTNPIQADTDPATRLFTQRNPRTVHRCRRQAGTSCGARNGSGAVHCSKSRARRGVSTTRTVTTVNERINPPANNWRGSITRITRAAAAIMVGRSVGRTRACPSRNTTAMIRARTAPGRAPVAYT